MYSCIVCGKEGCIECFTPLINVIWGQAGQQHAWNEELFVCSDSCADKFTKKVEQKVTALKADKKEDLNLAKCIDSVFNENSFYLGNEVDEAIQEYPFGNPKIIDGKYHYFDNLNNKLLNRLYRTGKIKDKKDQNIGKTTSISDDISNNIFSLDVSTSELRIRNQIDMKNLQRHAKKVGSFLGEMADIFAGNTSDPTLRAGFNALIYQNAIVIRQNEMILRALTGHQENEKEDNSNKEEIEFDAGSPCLGCGKIVPDEYDKCPFCGRRLKLPF